VSLAGLQISPTSLLARFFLGAFVEPALAKLLFTGELCERRLLFAS